MAAWQGLAPSVSRSLRQRHHLAPSLTTVAAGLPQSANSSDASVFPSTRHGRRSTGAGPAHAMLRILSPIRPPSKQLPPRSLGNGQSPTGFSVSQPAFSVLLPYPIIAFRRAKMQLSMLAPRAARTTLCPSRSSIDCGTCCSAARPSLGRTGGGIKILSASPLNSPSLLSALVQTPQPSTPVAAQQT